MGRTSKNKHKEITVEEFDRLTLGKFGSPGRYGKEWTQEEIEAYMKKNNLNSNTGLESNQGSQKHIA